MATTTENIILVLPDIVKEMTLQGQQYSLIGIDTETPMLKISKLTFRGTWHETIGSNALIESDESADQVIVVGVSTKCIKFDQMYLTPKPTPPTTTET